MRRFLSILLALGLVVSFSLVTAVPALAVPEVWVNVAWAGSSPGDIVDGHTFGTDAFATIQEGIDAADLLTGVVHVAAGTYNEHDIDMQNGVKVLGAGADVTTIDGGNSGTVVKGWGLTSTNTQLDGFTIEGGNGGSGGGMHIYNGSPRVSNCVFTGNYADNGGGICISNGSSATVVNCVFIDNHAYFTGGGIDCRLNSNPTIINNTIVGNEALGGNSEDGGGGIYSYTHSFPVIINNIIVGNKAEVAPFGAGGGILTTSTPPPTIDYNDVYGNTAFVIGEENYGGTCFPPLGAHDISVDPKFVVGDPKYHLDETIPSPCIDAGDNTAVPDWLENDYDGEPRIWQDADDPVVDMGADEYSDNQPPYAPDITSSGYRDGSWTDDNTPEFSFTQDDPNDWDTVKYTFQIDDDPLFGSPAVNFTSGLLDQDILEVFTSPPLPDGEYYWHVRSTDRFDAEGLWADGSLTPGEPAFRLDTSPAPPPGGAVGGTVYPIDKAVLLLPWLGLSIFLILAAGGLILVRRRTR